MARLGSIYSGALVCLALTTAATSPARAVAITGDNVFVLDFIANGDGVSGLSNLPVAVYWQWDGANTLGIRMETPFGSAGFGNFWSFNVFNNGLNSPGGVDSNDSNNSSNVISASGIFTDNSLGAYGVKVDAIEASWTQPNFDSLQPATYIQLSMFGPSGPSDGYRMAEYLNDLGTYANSPDILPTSPGGGSVTQRMGLAQS